MPIRRRLSNTRLLSLGLIAVGIAAVIIVAIFFRQGAFSVVAEGQGASIKLNFAESRVDLSQLLDKLLEETGEGHDADAKRRLVSSILQAHHYYYVLSVEAVTAIREIGETDAARDSARAMRTMLYDLAGPFARPATLSEARDDRLLLAIDDLYQHYPDNPIITKLSAFSPAQLEAQYALPSCPFRCKPSSYSDSCESRLYIQPKAVCRGIAGGAPCV